MMPVQMRRAEQPCTACGYPTQAPSGLCRRCRQAANAAPLVRAADTRPPDTPIRTVVIDGQAYDVVFDGTRH